MYALGIDLGTTFTAAATWRGGHAEIVALGSRTAAVPSVVLLREDETFLTGEPANRRHSVEAGELADEEGTEDDPDSDPDGDIARDDADDTRDSGDVERGTPESGR